MSVLPIGFGSSSGYNIDNSVRLRASASAYLSSTFGTPTDATRGTFVFRVKRGTLSSIMQLFCDDTNGATINFLASNAFEVNANDAGSNKYNDTNKLYRDSSAWYYILVAIDTNLGTAADRLKIYDCDVRLTLSASSNFGSGTSPKLLQAGTKHLGTYHNGTQDFFDGLFSDIYFIDGQALTPSDFGELNTDGVWVPKVYTGTYGTNGFHLDFKDAAVTSGSNAGLGKDVSGNGNYWNTTNISVTAGVTYDALTDTPTNNFCVLNPLDRGQNSTLSNANLTYAYPGGTNYFGHGASVAVSSGKWYWEVYAVSNGGYDSYLGILDATLSPTLGTYPAIGNVWIQPRQTGSIVYYKNEGGSTLSFSATNGVGYTYGIAFDAAAKKLWFSINGVWQQSGVPETGTSPLMSGFSGSAWKPGIMQGGGSYYAFTDAYNFGQRPFSYTPPTGFKALCTANLPAVAIPNPKKHFDIVTRAGTAASYSVSGLQFQPDMAWIKSRGRSVDHAIYDAVRGVEKRLESNNSGAEVTGDTTGLTAFNSTGYSGGALDQINGTTATNAFVDWLWKAGGAPTTDNVAGAGNTPTAGSVKIDGTNLGSALAGSIAATRLSANTTAGFSIVTYTGNGGTSSSTTVAHGLGKTPAMVIHKSREADGSDLWNTWHTSLGGNYGIWLNSTAARNSGMWTGYSNFTTAVFTPPDQTYGNVNTVDYVAYCFAEIPGYSKFGSYTGNGSSDGPFVYCGFRPKYVLIKRTDGVGDWLLHDCSRSTYNPDDTVLYPNSTVAEAVGGGYPIDETANGFKIRSSATYINVSTGTFVYMAFAEFPFGDSKCSPAPAR